MLELYNSAIRHKQPFVPLDPTRVRLYVCGPTVYDHIHIGNARTFVVFDLLFRLLRYHYGHNNVLYVRNITDIDDKIIAAAQRDAIEVETVAETMAEHFLATLKHLGTLPPTHQPRATAHVDRMIAMIQLLLAGKHAYEADGHVLFDVTSDADYGNLSRRSAEEMRAGARVEIAPYKRNPTDFVLWKPSPVELPGWTSPWGRGRPGWHIECSAMAAYYLDPPFDIHGGGIDLIFPHHENECAQTRCLDDSKASLAQFWLHVGFLQLAEKKMSKSLGNTLTLDALLSDHPAAAIRLCLLMAHYRQPHHWRPETLIEARTMLARWRRAAEPVIHDDTAMPAATVLAALDDDLNTPQALAAMHQLAARAQSGDNHAAAELAASMTLLGLDDATAKAAKSHRNVDHGWVEKQIAARALARQARDFATADTIRDRLAAAGIRLCDSPSGTQWEHHDKIDPDTGPDTDPDTDSMI